MVMRSAYPPALRGKKGWIRIVEAVIGILIVAGVLLAVYSQNTRFDNSDYIYELEDKILRDIALDVNYRQAVLDGNVGLLEGFVSGQIPNDLSFELQVCDAGQVCNMQGFIEGDIYADEILISSTLDDYDPKKVKLFVWKVQ